MMGHRSHSAAPMDSPSVRYRGRSQSPTGHRSLSPPEHRSIPYSHGYVHSTRYEISLKNFLAFFTFFTSSRQLKMEFIHAHLFRFASRSATATPTGSPKKRQLPQIPATMKERIAQDLEERARFMRHRSRPMYRSTGMGSEFQFFFFPLKKKV
jgi:regulating synaptic membrane exocytosis protein 2